MPATRRSFLLLAANTPWVDALAESLAAFGAATAVRLYDWANYHRLKPQWPRSANGVHQVLITMPQGYAGVLERVFRPMMCRLVRREQARLRRQSGADPVVICPYPYLAPWVRHIPGQQLVYYNLDDYILYDPARAARIMAGESELVERAHLTLCLSSHQAETLRARHPDQAGRIAHFPLGVVEDFVNPAPGSPPLPRTVGYVGNLTERVDWAFFEAVAQRLPGVRFHIVGSLGAASAGEPPWQVARTRVLRLPNVVHEGSVPQAAVREHYWRYAANWMPYDMGHRFNIASCPTKIMDALASGRPFVSTEIPEVRLYPDHIVVVRTPDEAASTLRMVLWGGRPHDPQAQVAYACTQTWPHRTKRLFELLDAATRAGCVAA